MTRLSNLFGKLFEALAIAAALTLLGMVVLVTADILLRNLTRTGFRLGQRGLRIRPLCDHAAGRAVAAAPRPACADRPAARRVLPPRVAWLMEAVGDVLGFAVCVVMVRYGFHMAADSFRIGSLTIKNLVFPEWWLLAPLPLIFALIAAEFGFRFHRLMTGERTRRIEATSVS